MGTHPISVKKRSQVSTCIFKLSSNRVILIICFRVESYVGDKFWDATYVRSKLPSNPLNLLWSTAQRNFSVHLVNRYLLTDTICSRYGGYSRKLSWFPEAGKLDNTSEQISVWSVSIGDRYQEEKLKQDKKLERRIEGGCSLIETVISEKDFQLVRRQVTQVSEKTVPGKGYS